MLIIVFSVAKNTSCDQQTFQRVRSAHRTYDGTPPKRHFPLYVGSGLSSDIHKSNAVYQFGISALQVSSYDMDQNFDGKYPKLCVTMENIVGLSGYSRRIQMEQLKKHFNFALDTFRRPQYTMFINFNNECKLSSETKHALESRKKSAATSCRSDNLRSQRGSKDPGLVHVKVHTIGMLKKKYFIFMKLKMLNKM